MKNIILFLGVFLFMGALNAQSSNDEIDYIQSIFGMEKRAAVKEFVELTPAEKDAFWNIYDEYEVKRKVLGKERIILLDKFVEGYDTMTDKESAAYMKSVMVLRDKNEKLISTYYKKTLKVCSPVVAMKFYQIESYILAGTRFQILEEVPF
ncbi:MAG: hypothetical protein PF450_07075 [Bacteroidales bacterium]|jgi:hypothetical protein|nr:hypothetical protein [Bacteroidales bacterium]